MPPEHAAAPSWRSDAEHAFWWVTSFGVDTPTAQPAYFCGQVLGTVHTRGAAAVSHVAPVAVQSTHAAPFEPQRLLTKPPTHV
jgi:hypothetical protein